MTMHPFRAAIESGASPEEFAALFASDVTFHTPITFLARFVTPTQSVALWEANFSGYPMQGLQIDQLDTEGPFWTRR